MIAELIAGEAVTDIAAQAGIRIWRVLAVRRELPEADQKRRRAAISKQVRAGDSALDHSTTLAVVEAAVPKGMDWAVRDDVVAELVLAIMEGRLEAEQIKGAVRSFVSRGLSQWQSAYGPSSLDAPIGADDRRTRGDMIEDPTALGEIDDIIIGDGV